MTQLYQNCKYFCRIFLNMVGNASHPCCLGVLQKAKSQARNHYHIKLDFLILLYPIVRLFFVPSICSVCRRIIRTKYFYYTELSYRISQILITDELKCLLSSFEHKGAKNGILIVESDSDWQHACIVC